MYIDLSTNGNVTDLSTNGNVTEVPRLYKEYYDKQFSYKTVDYENTQHPTLNPAVRIFSRPIKDSDVSYEPSVFTLPIPVTRRSRVKPTPRSVPEHWPPLPTESPESVKPYNPLYVGILSGVLIVAFVWAAVMVVFFRNKIQARRQRRRARASPSYLNTEYNSEFALTSSDISNIGTNPLFGLSEQSEPTVVNTGIAEYSSFTVIQPSAPSRTATSQNFSNEQPPSYAEIQQLNVNRILSSCEEQPPSYLEVQQQNRNVL